jgi:uncharacterized protein YbjT (DUF2867 family)
MKNKILVLGGNGKTGRKVAERLTALGAEVRIGSRGASPKFDWEDPSTWAEALKGMDKVYVTYQPDLAVPGAAEAIETLVNEAKRAKIKKLVLLSGKGEREAQVCEQVVIHSGIDYTIVRASWFNQNFSESFFLDALVAGDVALPQAQAAVPYVDTDDIADVVVQTLLDDKHNGQMYELTGPTLWKFEEVVNEIAKATGRKIAFTAITQEEYNKFMEENNVPADYIWLVSYLFTEVLADKENATVTNDIEKVLGRKPKSFEQFVKETAKTGVWD